MKDTISLTPDREIARGREGEVVCTDRFITFKKNDTAALISRSEIVPC